MAGNTYIDQSQTVNRTTKNIENEVRNTVNNINVDLSKIDMRGAVASFRQLEQVAKAANFDAFIEKIMTLKQTFADFQKAVKTANTSVTNFAKSSEKITGGNTAIVTNVDVSVPDVGSQMSEITSGISSSAASIGSCFSQMGAGALDFGNGVAAAAGGVSTLLDSVANLVTSFSMIGTSLISAATGVGMLIPLLPSLGESMLLMAANMAGLLEYIPQLLVFVATMAVFALLGEGLAAAGTGMVNIGLGLTSMTAGMEAPLEFMPTFIASLADITANVGGIILFVLLAASMLAMAIAIQMMNEQMGVFVANMEKLHTLVGAGFVAAFAVFGVTLIAMSLFMDKVATGMDKVTKAMEQQAIKLAILNPLLAAQAILTNPIVGAITVAAAVAGGILVKALFPAMATGGVVTGPTVALVGEGRYPEAVVPLGDSPQFGAMKADIANAVVQAMRMTSGSSGASRSGGEQVVLNIDGKTFARLILPQLRKEGYRHGYDIAMKGV